MTNEAGAEGIRPGMAMSSVRAAWVVEDADPYGMQVHTFAYQIQIQLQPQLQPRHSPAQIQIQTQKHPHTHKHIHPHSQKESGAGLLKVLKTLRLGVFTV